MSNLYSKNEIYKLIENAIDSEVSDIHISYGDFVRFEVHGRISTATNHTLDHAEVNAIFSLLYKGDSGSVVVTSGSEVNFRYIHRYLKSGGGEARDYTFRVNAAAIMVNGEIGIMMTARLINEEPPLWRDFGYGEDLWDKWRPDNGLVLVCGATGQGKSTLLASGIRRTLEEGEDEKIITLESPIEYNQHKYQRGSTIVAQREVPRNSKDFVRGLESALRQAPSILVVGEASTKETILATLSACKTGHLVYSTMHTNSVPETGSRAIEPFEPGARESVLSDLIYSSRLFLNQRLLKSTDGKRVGIREILPFDHDVTRILESTPPKDIKRVMRKLVNEYGQPFFDSASKYFKEGLITKNQIKEISDSAKNELK